MSCNKLVQIILKEGWKDPKLFEDEKKCVIDFRHPKIKPEEPVSYFLSSVDFDKEKNVLKATVRSKVDNYKEVFPIDPSVPIFQSNLSRYLKTGVNEI